ncbi:hypothetical protein S7711_07505 [Stachybotrys chartarum IBT 7711]|uniref:lytic cellulose monooxygenase (C4-dehydrogenating) n=1 Tax=Stachybotrys chartarum (strain CBS 109288 / IBT 7711) TaxID=1280523 RepID=A0A084B7F2_STACB|nr:hypothetical protein S7711_07505 [Stachybotrys chartarum IBT 7711]KFA49989.1 hypothetical protein S40293_05956 [Stachybotrys chartarum IBT 40293]
MTSSLFQAAVWLGLMASTVLSHGLVTSWSADGRTEQGFLLQYYYDRVNGFPVPSIASWYTENLDSGFVSPAEYQTPHINCHRNAIPGTRYATVAAGGQLTFNWTPTPWAHPYGPILTYVARCPGECTNVDKNTLRWVKIEQVGIVNPSTQQWAQQVLINNNGSWTTTVPRSLAPGNYVFRHELIAVHAAVSSNGTQNYPQCFNVRVTGSGTANPTGVLGTELYNWRDPGILFNPYLPNINYQFPGPALWTG